MLSIPEPPIRKRGIFLYVKVNNMPKNIRVPINLVIEYSKTNFKVLNKNCNKKVIKIVDQEISHIGKGFSFSHEMNIDLEMGYYFIGLSLNNFMTGEDITSIIISLSKNTPRLVIGYPYSIYENLEISYKY